MRTRPKAKHVERGKIMEDGITMNYTPSSYRRFSSAHTELNKTARILGVGLATVQALAGWDPSGDVISAVVRKVSPHWSGDVPFADIRAEAPVAIASISRLLLVQAVAAFEQFIAEADVEVGQVLTAQEAVEVKVDPVDNLEWSSILNRYLKLCEKLEPKVTEGQSIKDLAVIGEMFVRLRNRVAHTTGDESASSLKEILESKTLRGSWDRLAETTSSKQIPFLDFTISKAIPNLDLPHAVLASIVFHRLAGLEKKAFLALDTESRVLRLAVAEMRREKPLPITPEKRARRVSYFLGRGGCTRWSSREIIQVLKREGLWGTCLQGLKGS